MRATPKNIFGVSLACVVLTVCCNEIIPNEIHPTTEPPSVRLCPNSTINGYIRNVTTLRIPPQFTRNQQEQFMTLKIDAATLNCDDSSLRNYTLHYNDSAIFLSQNGTNSSATRSFWTAEGASVTIPVHFQENGIFADGLHYYSPDGDYCLESYTSKSINLKLCPVEVENSIFVPKCCAMDEVVYRLRTCRKLLKNQTQWKPELYVADTYGSHTIMNYNTKHLKLYNLDLSQKCAKRDPIPHPYYFYWSPTGMGTGVKHDVKLAVRPDKPNYAFPLYFDSETREWLLKEKVNFCIDGTYQAKLPPRPNRPAYYTGDPAAFVMYVCTSDDAGRDNSRKQSGKSWAYAVTTSIASLFLLATVLIYVLFLSKHNLHGLTVLMYSIAMLGRYLFSCIAYLISIYPNDHITGVTRRGWPCVTMGIVGHYFYLSCYMWLTVMNFNFLRTFRKTQVIQRNDKCLKVFFISAALAWGLPLLLVGSFRIIDIVYEDPLTEVPVPGYGDKVCFVSRPFRGYYLYTPMGIMLGLNIPLILLTLRIFWKAKMSRKKQLGSSNSQSTAPSDYSAGFFVKLFVIMGGGDLINFLTWYYHEPIQENAVKPVWVIVLECGNFLTPVLLFILFCLNRRTRRQLMEWYRVSRLGSYFNGKLKDGSAPNSGTLESS